MSEEKLSYYVENLDNIPEILQEHYAQEDDGYVLNVAGVTTKKKLDEFRDNNKKLQDELDKLKFVDLDEYKNLKAAAEKDATKGLVQEHDVDQLVNTRVTEMRDVHLNEVSELNKQLESSTAQLQTLLIDNSVAQSATKHRVKENAVEDVLLRAKNVFRVENGEVIGYGTDGEKAYNKDGDALTIDDWINVLEKQAAHLFQDSTGAGTLGNKSGLAPKAQLSGAERIQEALQKGNT
jgi:hypothetical protein